MNEKMHKSKPAQFESVAGGVNKRLKNNSERWKKSRLAIFDSMRHFSELSSSRIPVPISQGKKKVQHRLLQLQKWKKEMQNKKKELATQKKKPFVVGVPHHSLSFVPPPPPKAVPSTSSCVSTAKNRSGQSETKQSESFAPKNAVFHAPRNISTMTYFPKLSTVGTKKETASVITFDPVIYKKAQNVAQPNVLKISTSKNIVPKSESSVEQRLRSPEVPSDGDIAPEQNAECVTMSRGKYKARKEMKNKLEEAAKKKARGLQAGDGARVKTFDGGFFSVLSPERAPTRSKIPLPLSTQQPAPSAAPPTKPTLGRSDAVCEGEAPLPRVPLPGRGILKPPHGAADKTNKSRNVHFERDVTTKDRRPRLERRNAVDVGSPVGVGAPTT